MTENAANLDMSTLTWLLVIGLGIVGAMRGVRSEAITLAGVMAAGVVFSNEGMRSRVVSVINKAPRIFEVWLAPEGAPVPVNNDPGFIGDPDQRLFFYLVAFLAVVGFFFYGGIRYGGAAATRTDRVLGAVMGSLSGFVVSVTLLNFSQDYLSRHENVAGVTFELPKLVTPTLPSQNFLVQYTPLVFIAGLAVMAFVVVTSLVKR
jgi:hypothetical protein